MFETFVEKWDWTLLANLVSLIFLQQYVTRIVCHFMYLKYTLHYISWLHSHNDSHCSWCDQWIMNRLPALCMIWNYGCSPSWFLLNLMYWKWQTVITVDAVVFPDILFKDMSRPLLMYLWQSKNNIVSEISFSLKLTVFLHHNTFNTDSLFYICCTIQKCNKKTTTQNVFLLTASTLSLLQ